MGRPLVAAPPAVSPLLTVSHLGVEVEGRSGGEEEGSTQSDTRRGSDLPLHGH